MTPMYKAEATSEGGREGRSHLTEGGLDLTMAMPKEMGGNGQGNNPEQLFALGYSACFLGALRLVARNQGKKADGAEITADVTIGKEGEGFELAVELKGRLPGMDRAEAQKLMEDAHQVCPYSKATRGNIPVTLSVV